MSVRGISNNHDGGNSALIMDGMAYAESLELNPYLIGSIDVLKSGISALYGKSSPGGVVNINLKKQVAVMKERCFKIWCKQSHGSWC